MDYRFLEFGARGGEGEQRSDWARKAWFGIQPQVVTSLFFHHLSICKSVSTWSVLQLAPRLNGEGASQSRLSNYYVICLCDIILGHILI